MNFVSEKEGRQRTVKKAIGFSGIGLHTNRAVEAVIEPADPGTGIRIFRLDTGSLIPADYRYVVDTSFATVVGNKGGDRVSTIEHFMAALYAMEIDNAIIKVDGPEFPILDGSSYHVATHLAESGYVELDGEREVLSFQGNPITIQLDSSFITIEESETLIIDLAVEFPGTLIGEQKLEFILSPARFLEEISRARTFVLKEQIEGLWASGLALGGSLENAVVVDGQKVLNGEGLRYEDEFVRHKTLDLIGDLSLLGRRVRARITAFKPGHTINSMAIKEISRSISGKPEERERQYSYGAPVRGALRSF